MEVFPSKIMGSSLQIEGIADAARTVRLKGRKSQRLAELALHRVDLQFALDSLAAVNPMGAISPFHREVMWRSAILHFFKCFGGHHARFSLQPQQVYRGEPPEAIENFEHFKLIRNKHLVHDENALAQGIAGAVLNDGTKSYKVEKIVSASVFVVTLEQNSYSNMELLIRKALEWVTGQIDSLAVDLTNELEAMPYAELAAMEDVAYAAPTSAELARTRARIGSPASNAATPRSE